MKKLIFILSIFTISAGALTAQAAGLLSGGLKTSITNNTVDMNSQAGFNSSVGVLEVVQSVIVALLALLAIIFIGFLIYAGFKWMMAGGDADDVKKAQTTIRNSIIGLIVVLASYGITYFVFSYLPFNGVAPTPSGASDVNHTTDSGTK